MPENISNNMASTIVEHASKINIGKKENESRMRKIKALNPSYKKTNKHEENRHHKFGRKRLQSFTGNSGKFFSPCKRRKKEGFIVPPTKFLLGGNICDPLNLNSMQDEEINRAMNAVTPKSSPLPMPKHKKEAIEPIIPPNINDPLNLINCTDNEEYEKQLISPTKKSSKKKKKKRKKSNVNATMVVSESVMETSNVSVLEDKNEEMVAEAEQANFSIPQIPETKSSNLKLKILDKKKLDFKDKIVSPVIPQPGAWKSRSQHRPNHDKKKKSQQPNFKSKNARFQYGNYNRYYGYRNPNGDFDPRLGIFLQRKHIFCGKDVLDIGCNIGHITLSVAKDLGAHSVTGIDIDKSLINIARKNIKHYVNCGQSPRNTDDTNPKDVDVSFFPISMPIIYGPVDVPGFTKQNHKGFPYNVTFVQGNYVLEDDSLLSLEQAQFDVILCLSTTKWIHLNFGDAGMKQTFKRIYAQLRPGGILILEPQSYTKYGKRKNLTETIYKNYQSMEFYPQNFTKYLLSPEVGFSKCEVISMPKHPSKGFQRPLYLYTKENLSETSPASVIVESSAAVERRERRLSAKQQEQQEQREYEKNLFPDVTTPQSYISAYSQRSGESLSQYDMLEKVYAPSVTPCYTDTPVHSSESQLPDSAKIHYVDVKIDNEVEEPMDNEDSSQNEDNLKETVISEDSVTQDVTSDPEPTLEK